MLYGKVILPTKNETNQAVSKSIMNICNWKVHILKHRCMDISIDTVDHFTLRETYIFCSSLFLIYRGGRLMILDFFWDRGLGQSRQSIFFSNDYFSWVLEWGWTSQCVWFVSLALGWVRAGLYVWWNPTLVECPSTTVKPRAEDWWRILYKVQR